jgi:hypothetical protein
MIAEFQIRPDFYLPELDLYIEYWGMDTPQYKIHHPPSTARDTETQRRPSFTQTPKGKKYKCGVNFSARVLFDGSTSSPQAKLRAGNGENKRHGLLEEDQEGEERGISSSFS